MTITTRQLGSGRGALVLEPFRLSPERLEVVPAEQRTNAGSECRQGLHIPLHVLVISNRISGALELRSSFREKGRA